MGLTREQFLSLDYKPTVVEVPTSAGSVYVRKMKAMDRVAWSKLLEHNDIVLRMVVMTCCDENGNLLFTDKDIIALNDKDPDMLDAIWQAALLYNQRAIDPKSVEVAAKN